MKSGVHAPNFCCQKGDITTRPIIEEFKTAQAALADDYIVWADAESRGETVDVVLHSVRLSTSIRVDPSLMALSCDRFAKTSRS